MRRMRGWLLSVALALLAAGCSGGGGGGGAIGEQEPNDSRATALDLGVLAAVAVVSGAVDRVAVAGLFAAGDLDYVRFH